jgi:hypothetical protein
MAGDFERSLSVKSAGGFKQKDLPLYTGVKVKLGTLK